MDDIKTIDGKRYKRIYSFISTKKDAKKIANRYRRQGIRTRIIKQYVGKLWGYHIYTKYIESYVIMTDGDIDIKDVKRAMLDYLNKNRINHTYCHAKTIDCDFEPNEIIRFK